MPIVSSNPGFAFADAALEIGALSIAHQTCEASNLKNP